MSDPEDDSLNYALDVTYGNAGYFTMRSNGVLEVSSAINFEDVFVDAGDGNYDTATVSVRVLVDDSTNTVSRVFDVSVQNVNEPPSFDTPVSSDESCNAAGTLCLFETAAGSSASDFITLRASDPDKNPPSFRYTILDGSSPFEVILVDGLHNIQLKFCLLIFLGK